MAAGRLTTRQFNLRVARERAAHTWPTTSDVKAFSLRQRAPDGRARTRLYLTDLAGGTVGELGEGAGGGVGLLTGEADDYGGRFAFSATAAITTKNRGKLCVMN